MAAILNGSAACYTRSARSYYIIVNASYITLLLRPRTRRGVLDLLLRKALFALRTVLFTLLLVHRPSLKSSSSTYRFHNIYISFVESNTSGRAVISLETTKVINLLQRQYNIICAASITKVLLRNLLRIII